MKINTLVKLLRGSQLKPSLKIFGMLKPFYTLSFVASAKTNGLFDLLSGGPLPFEQLAGRYCRDARAQEALTAWLQLGIRLKLLKLDHQGYSLQGLAKSLAEEANDATIALAQEVAGLHHSLILGTPAKLQQGSLWSLDDQDGRLIARSSRSLEPFQTEAIDSTFPSSGAVRLLEIGCGSAFYIYYAAQKNSQLTARGIELQSDVAELAQRNIEGWGLQDRVKIEVGDIRHQVPGEHFDIVTLYNNIYYFPFEERPALLAHLRTFLKPGGFLLLTTAVQGGNLGIEVLNLWGAATAGCGRLSQVDEMVTQLRSAGFTGVQAIKLIPGFYAFKAHQPASS